MAEIVFENVQHPEWGKIGKATTYGELRKLAPLKDKIIENSGPEQGVVGCQMGSVIAAGTKSEIQITWNDKTDDKFISDNVDCKIKPVKTFSDASKVRSVEITHAGSAWKNHGVGAGTNMLELEKITGKNIGFSGFEWDYGGGLNAENDSEALAGVTLWMDYDAHFTKSEQAYIDKNLVGDVEANSAKVPASIKKHIKVGSINYTFSDE